MKIVIDIPEDAFKYIKDNKKLGWIGDYELAEAIANGIPLPSAEKTAECDNNHDCEHCDWTECPLEVEKETDGESK